MNRMECGEKKTSLTADRHEPLRARYRAAPDEAWFTDAAQTVYDSEQDPFHGSFIAGEWHEAPTRFGIHKALGGDHDLPNPGDFLCAALAACLDATVRLIADRLRLRIDSLKVVVTAEADARGPLQVDPTVAVGFQRMTCRVRIVSADSDPAYIRAVIAAAERCCVVLNTLRDGVAVEMLLESPPTQRARKPRQISATQETRHGSHKT